MYIYISNMLYFGISVSLYLSIYRLLLLSNLFQWCAEASLYWFVRVDRSVFRSFASWLGLY